MFCISHFDTNYEENQIIEQSLVNATNQNALILLSINGVSYIKKGKLIYIDSIIIWPTQHNII